MLFSLYFYYLPSIILHKWLCCFNKKLSPWLLSYVNVNQLSTIAQANKVLQRWCALVFYRITPCLTTPSIRPPNYALLLKACYWLNSWYFKEKDNTDFCGLVSLNTLHYINSEKENLDIDHWHIQFCQFSEISICVVKFWICFIKLFPNRTACSPVTNTN